MKSDNPTLQKLFEGEKEYGVPLYQRLYVWNEVDQWAPLWEDITGIAARLAETKEVTPHFFGAIVLKIGGTTPKESSVWRVIDGQQRLTTMQLAIAAVAHELADRGENPRDVARLKELIENPSHAWPERRYKMRHSGNNYALFTKVLDAEGDEEVIRQLSSTAASGQPDSAMVRCYLYFRNAARRWLQSATDESAAEHLTDTLRTKLQIVAIYLELPEPEHLIFETLNARGAALTEWDKIRNYLFYRVPQEDQDDLFRDCLSRFDENWWRARSGTGQDQRPRTDRFVDYWLESKIEKPIGVRRIFREFRDRADDLNQKALVAGVEAMAQDADYYRRFESGKEGATDIETLFHQRRRWMGLGAFWPFLLGLHRVETNQEQLWSVLSTLESWFVRRWIRGHQSRNYPDRALELLRLVSGSKGRDGASVADRVIGRLEEIEAVGGRWPTEPEMKRAVTTGHWSWRLRYFVLNAIERHITPRTAEKDGLKHGELHVEHIMPVKWKEWWPIEGNSPEAGEERDRLIQTLGNLTLVHGRLNTSMSNRTWEKKRTAIFENSTLFLNKDILRRAPDTWDEDAIRKRGEWMAEQVCEIWPHAEVLRQRLGEP